MKIAVSAMGPDLEAEVDPRFGRCQYLLIVDTTTMEVEALPNAGSGAGGGAGTATAQLVATGGAEAVLTGNCGPNAYQVLQAAGIQVVSGVAGRVRDVDYKAGRYQASAGPSVGGHFGLGGGGRGPGPGAGRAGGGRGR
ncbi:MAG: dinitrogenase iron-molybdenum cofactor biosynthesis protein [Clostridia bacterium]|nr:MAG: dinitrogenase iron-molybdenum cofactor biosynthesis protein [Clostridia bacterium]